MKKSVGAVFVCSGEVFFIRRQEKLRDFPGYISFPGGKVEPSESLQEALFREVAEEVGVDLAGLQGEGVVEKIVSLGDAISPAFNPVRFTTHFFKIVLREKVPFVADPAEIAEGRWVTPAGAVSLYRKGKMLLVPPTLRIFEELEENIETELIKALNHEYDEAREVPAVELVSGVVQLIPLSPTLPPADRTNAFLLGDGEVLVDPSPSDQSEYDKFKGTLLRILKGKKLKHIFLTHHHPDHHHQAPRLARELGATFLLSEDTHHRLGEDYFEGVPCRHKKEGDTLTFWQDEKVVVHEVPGHDRGQLALIPQSKDWAILGDLFQTVGTVVIAWPEGDMKEYFQSLERMIALAPKVIFPSHGMPLGGVNKLVVTLEHRREREAQIQGLLQKNWSEDEIFTEVYGLLPEALHTVARATLKAHIHKIEQQEKV